MIAKSFEHHEREVQLHEEHVLKRYGVSRGTLTVGGLKGLLADVDDAVEVVISHQPLFQSVGIQNPLVYRAELAQQEFDPVNARLFCNGQFRSAVIFE